MYKTNIFNSDYSFSSMRFYLMSGFSYSHKYSIPFKSVQSDVTYC